MKRDEINPRVGDVWVGRDWSEKIVTDGPQPVRWYRPDTPHRQRRCSLSTFRDWVGAKGYRRHPTLKNTTEPTLAERSEAAGQQSVDSGEWSKR